MEPEDVVHVLRRLRETLVPDGLVLDLQVVPPDPVVECGARALCEIDGSLLLAAAAEARDAVDRLVAEHLLEEETRVDLDVLRHYANGAALVDGVAESKRVVPPDMVPILRALTSECAVRDRCRLRRLRVSSA